MVRRLIILMVFAISMLLQSCSQVSTSVSTPRSEPESTKATKKAVEPTPDLSTPVPTLSPSTTESDLFTVKPRGESKSFTIRLMGYGKIVRVNGEDRTLKSEKVYEGSFDKEIVVRYEISTKKLYIGDQTFNVAAYVNMRIITNATVDENSGFVKSEQKDFTNIDFNVLFGKPSSDYHAKLK